MMFSQRMGITPLEKPIQIDGIDSELKNRLWNLYSSLLHNCLENIQYYEEIDIRANNFFMQCLWNDYFKLKYDDMPRDRSYFHRFISEEFFNSKWYRVYDLMEVSLKIMNFLQMNIDSFQKKANMVLEQEFAGYRFINGIVSPITNDSEISSINETLALVTNFSALRPCNIHLTEALKKLSDKLNPDYRNSIKESISAIESLVKILSKDPKATLGEALSKLRNSIQIHRSLEEGIKKIYGYTSDEGGIRHALMDEATCDFEDAKYMLVSSSAFINFLIGKALKAGIELSVKPT